MTKQLTKEELDAKAVDAMQAIEGLKEFQKKSEAKLDGLDLEEINRRLDIATEAAEASQKARLRTEAEEKSRKDFEKAIEDEVKKIHEKAETEAKRVGDVELALQRQTFAAPSSADEAKELAAKWQRGLDQFMRKSNRDEPLNEFLGRVDEFKSLSVINDPEGGYLVSPVVDALLRSRYIETSPMRSIANVRTIGKDHIEFPTYNDRAAIGGWVIEKQSRPVTDTPKFGMQKIFANELYAEPAATQKMIDDADFDVEGFLTEEITSEFTRAENTAFVTGDGIEKPRGFLSYKGYDAAGVFQQGAIEQIKTGTNGTIGYDNLIDLMGNLKEPYQANAVLFGKRATQIALLKIKNTYGDPIFNQLYDKNGGLQISILGQQFIFADDMPAPATNSLSLAYGDFRKGYMIVDRIGVRLLRDPYTSKPFVLYYMTKRVGGDVTNFEAIKLLKLGS